MGWIGYIHCEKFWHDIVAQTFASIGPVQFILHQVSGSNEMIPNAPKHCETDEKGGLWSNGLLGCVRCENFEHEFVARTFELIAPVQPIFYRVSCSNETIPNAPKHSEMHHNMSLGSNVVDWVRALWTMPTQLRGMNFCINYTSSACVVPSFMK